SRLVKTKRSSAFWNSALTWHPFGRRPLASGAQPHTMLLLLGATGGTWYSVMVLPGLLGSGTWTGIRRQASSSLTPQNRQGLPQVPGGPDGTVARKASRVLLGAVSWSGTPSQWGASRGMRLTSRRLRARSGTQRPPSSFVVAGRGETLPLTRNDCPTWTS